MIQWTKILAAMLFLQAPGKSIYSKVEVSKDSTPVIQARVNGTNAYRLPREGEELPNQCKQQGNIACYYPRLRDVVSNGRNIRTSWQRIETYDEGLERYALIAKSIESVLKENEWKYPVGQLWPYLLTIAFHESGYRRDVHSGIGSAALGDCAYGNWKTLEDPRPGSCRSHGLFQTLFPSPDSVIRGHKRKDVIGVTEENTQAAVFVAAGHVAGALGMCERRRVPGAACVFAAYGGMVSYGDPRIQARKDTYNKVKSAPTKLNDYVRKVLGLDRSS